MKQNFANRLMASTAAIALVTALTTNGMAQSPQAPTIAAGSIAVTRQGQTTVVTQGTDKGIIDWRSFSIGPQEAVRFDQPGRSSVTLNRVTGTEQSRIDGNLSATGQVWLANPNGVMIGPGGQVNVGGLLATTGRIDAQEFLRSGRAVIDQIPKDAALINAGSILAGDGGYAALAAAAIENKGVVAARAGTIAAGAGKAMTLDFTGDKLISFQVTQPLDQGPAGAGSLVSNTGTLSAPGGVVLLSARAAKDVLDRVINLDGYAVATSIQERNGVIVIDGGDNGRVDVSGKLLVSGGTTNNGGAVELKGADVAISGAAVLDATGARGGAIAAIGGASLSVDGRLDASGEQSGGAIRMDAARVTIQSGSVVSARARETGNGGSVAIQADKALSIKGEVAVSGGANGGAGGAVMAASPGDLSISGRILASAPAGEGGRVAVAAGGKLTLDGAKIAATGGRSGGVVTMAGSQVVDLVGAAIDASGSVVSEIVEMTPDGQFANQLVRINPDGSMRNVPLPPSGGGMIGLRGRQLTINAETKVRARGTDTGGLINLIADQITLAGALDASGDKGGQINASANGLLQSGAMIADGATREGGVISVEAKNSFISTLSARLQADSVTGRGGQVRVIGTATGVDSDPASARVFSSGSLTARSISGRGGAVDVIGQDILLVAASLDASGGAGGGVVRIGGDWQGSGALAHAKTVFSSGPTQIRASATQAGDGGVVVVWSNEKTAFGSTVDARGAGGGVGGKVEVSSKGVLTFGGTVNAGSLLLDPKNITIDASVGTASSVALTDPGVGGTAYGSVISILPNGNIVVTSPLDSGGGVTNRGAAYLFSGATGALVSALTGSTIGDQVSSGGVTLLPVNGNYVISSPNWANGAAANAGAVTWGSGSSGVSGVVSAANSLVGSQTNDQVGSGGIIAFANGNYVVKSPNWANGAAAQAGAVTWGSGASGVSGAVSASNSLVGAQANDKVGSGNGTVAGVGGVIAVGGGAGYVVVSPNWANGAATAAGAVTWGSAASGVTGLVTPSNSLVGSQTNDQVGSGGITVLPNGNYLVSSPKWANGVAARAGAVTWGSGTGGVSGPVSSTNSLVGSQTDDIVGTTAFGGSSIVVLSGGGYVVNSPYWSNGPAYMAGAVTWGNGASGTSGVISAANSLVGSQNFERIGEQGVVALTNGNYVVSSRNWGSNYGAVTWGSGATGVSGVVSAANSLVGAQAGDVIGFASSIKELTNGNFVVIGPSWGGGKGAVTWVNGATGLSGVVSASNSLVGSQAADGVGNGGVTALTNGHYVVNSPLWRNGAALFAGAVTWGNGSTGVSGLVSASNSLVGSQSLDYVGFGGVTELSNGNYVVNSYRWANVAATQAGAVTWANGATGITGVVSPSNSLVGSQTNDQVGSGGVVALAGGNYLVRSPNWANGAAANAGAVTWGSGGVGVTGVVSASNSLVGGQANDKVGSGAGGSNNDTVVGTGGVTIVGGGAGYVVNSPDWANGAATKAGAVTWGSASAGVAGLVSISNSLVGSQTDDKVGSGGITVLPNGNYIVKSPNWANGAASKAGAVTWASGAAGIVGAVSASNSLVGSQTNDQVGSGAGTAAGLGAVTIVGGGAGYVVNSPNWANGGAANAGAVTWGSSTSGVIGLVSATNSLVGSQANDRVGSGGVTTLSNGNYVVRSPNWANGASAQAGAATWGSGTAGVFGPVSASNSIVGAAASDQVGFGGVVELANGNYYVANGDATVGTVSYSKSVTFGAGAGGTVGQIHVGNSFIGTAFKVAGAAPNGSFIVLKEQAGGLTQFRPTGGGVVSSANFSASPSSNLTVSAANLASTLASGTAITLQANNDITVNSAVNVSGTTGGALTMQAGRSIFLNASISTANGNLTLIANEQLANGVVDANRDPGAAVIVAAAGVTLNTGSGALLVKINDGAGLTNSASGDVQLLGVSAGALTIQNVGPSGGRISLGGPVTTTGSQSYGAAVTLASNLSLTSGGPITFSGAVDAATAGGSALTLTAGSSDITFNGNVGGASSLASLTQTGAGKVLLGGTLTTTGAQGFAGSIVVTGTAAEFNAGGVLTLSGPLDGQTTGANAVTFNAATTSISGGVGSTTPLASLSTGLGSVARLSGAVTTKGFQSYGGNVLIAGATVLKSSTSSIAFAGGVDSTSAGTNSLSLTMLGTGASPVFGGAIGVNAALQNLSISTTGAAVVLPTVTATNLSISTTDGAVSQSTGSLSVSGALTVTAGVGSIDLSNAANQIAQASLSTTNNAKILNSSGNLLLGPTTIGGAFSILGASGGTVSQNAALSASNLELLTTGANYSLTNAGNAIGLLAANTGSVNVTNGASGPLTVGSVGSIAGVFTTGAVTLTQSGSQSLIIGTTLSTTGGVALSSGGNLIITGTFEAGSASLTGGGTIGGAGSITTTSAPLTIGANGGSISPTVDGVSGPLVATPTYINVTSGSISVNGTLLVAPVPAVVSTPTIPTTPSVASTPTTSSIPSNATTASVATVTPSSASVASQASVATSPTQPAFVGLASITGNPASTSSLLVQILRPPIDFSIGSQFLNLDGAGSSGNARSSGDPSSITAQALRELVNNALPGTLIPVGPTVVTGTGAPLAASQTISIGGQDSAGGAPAQTIAVTPQPIVETFSGGIVTVVRTRGESTVASGAGGQTTGPDTRQYPSQPGTSPGVNDTQTFVPDTDETKFMD